MRKKEIKISPLMVVIVFLLGILIATNVFIFLEIQKTQAQIDSLDTEITKLKADDVAIAQVINNLMTQLELKGVITQSAP